jgi:hypothetical protein
VDFSDATSLHLDTIFTHYGRTEDSAADNILQFILGGTWEPNDHVAIDVDGSISPPSTTTAPAAASPGLPAGRYKERTSSLGALVSAEYDTAGESNLESAVDLTAGVTKYSTTQRRRSGVAGSRVSGPAQGAALAQWKMALGVTETLCEDTDLGVTGTYYLYSADPTDSGYYGAAVFGRGATAIDGIPLEPLRYAIRPSVVQRFGDLQVRASFQYGGHVDGAGYGVLGGVKIQYRIMRPLKVWVLGYHEHEIDGAGVGENIDWGSLGGTLYF